MIGGIDGLVSSIEEQVREWAEETAAELHEAERDLDEVRSQLHGKWVNVERMAGMLRDISDILWRNDLRQTSDPEALGKIRGLLVREDWEKWRGMY